MDIRNVPELIRKWLSLMYKMIHSISLVDDVRIQEVTYPIFIYLSCYYCPRWQRYVSFSSVKRKQ